LGETRRQLALLGAVRLRRGVDVAAGRREAGLEIAQAGVGEDVPERVKRLPRRAPSRNIAWRTGRASRCCRRKG
jgi:hypothetical protein